MQPSKIICVGRNYADHAKELGNDIPNNPLIFIKPPSSVNDTQMIQLAELTQNNQLGELHYECELSIKIGTAISKATIEQAKDAISAVTLGLDLTLRDIQNTLKSKGHPWERAKAFDHSCVFGDWLDISTIADLKNTHYELTINDETRQTGDTSLMLFPILELISNISQQFSLAAGDIIMTGTPKGVGALKQNDQLIMKLQTTSGEVSWDVSVH